MAENFGIVGEGGGSGGGGTFFSFGFYRQIISIYLPFAILGLIYLIKNKKFNYLFFYFVFNFLIVYLNLIFHKRFIIQLDLIIIILSAVSISIFASRMWKNIYGKIGTVILVLGVIINFLISIGDIKPLISDKELEAINSLSEITEENAYIMTVSSYYSPWIYGYSGRKTIAPGLFEYNKWNLIEWKAFWYSSNLEFRHQLLDEYEKPLYVYIGDKTGKMDFSDDPFFVKINDRLWQYKGK